MDQKNSIGDITRAISQFDSSDESAAELLWEQYFSSICQYAQSKVSVKNQRAIDSEAIASSAMQALFDGLSQNRFSQVNNREDLWRLLTTVASRKTSNAIRHYYRAKRGGGKVRGDSVFSVSEFNGANGRRRNHDPAEIVEVESTWETLLTQLPDDNYRQLATMRLSGFSNNEIAEQLKCTSRTVERKLTLIRKMLELINSGD